ncbi:MAG: RNA polymerase-associated protein RapA [Pontibacterium sp.]
MAHSQYIPGQRWISNTEAELGLGVVVETDGRRVTLAFPASEEERTYAVDNAPISRVEYAIGETVANTSGQSFCIEERHDNNGCLIYIGETDDGDTVVVPEIELDSFVQFIKPTDRLFAGQIDKLKAYQLRLDTLEYQHAQQQSEVYGLLGARVQPLPHQLYIASQVAGRHAPRVLLADEVGLGKTIEAGLILLQQIVTGRAERVLITVPDSLLYQWLVEMLRRFNLRFTVLDEMRCLTMDASGIENPFESAQLILCSQSFLSENPERHAQAMAATWDLMVVDEAHHLGWSEEAASHLYLAIEALAQQIPGVLLLTATPEQLGLEGHFARLRLLDPDRYNSLADFRKEEGGYKQVSQLVEHLQNDDIGDRLEQDTGLQQLLVNYLDQAAVDTLLSGLQLEEPQVAVKACIDKLLDQHGTGRVLFRNTRAAVTGFPERELQTYPLPAPDIFALKQADEPIEHQMHPERVLGSQWLQEDPRVAWLEAWLKEHRYEKTLLICAHKTTAIELEDHLRLRVGIRSAAFHEGLSLINRDRAAAYFADDEDTAQVLVCSEIGSEGRNFQFAHHLVMFDLPLNPDLLEQRIGRLDRIGQTETVQIHVPYYEDSAQDVLLRWYDEGVDLFSRPCAAGQQLFLQFATELYEQMQDSSDIDALEQLLEATHQETNATMQALQDGRDRLLELNSCVFPKAGEVVADVENASDRLKLSDYMERVFDQFGIDQQPHGQDSIVLHPTDHMLHHHFPGLPDEGLTATYRRSEALSREDMQFMTWEHPMVQGVMEMVLGSDFGNTAVCTMKLPPLKPGTLLLEAVFRVHCAAPKALQVSRYLPGSSVRIVVDSNGTDLSAVLGRAHFDKLGERVRRATAQNLIRHGREQIQGLVDKAESLVAPLHEATIQTALENVNRLQGAELERLQALAKVNPNVRSEEIEHQEKLQQQLAFYLGEARIHLDAVRIALVTD